MLMLVLTWIGIAIAATLLLLMALGPVIVELDNWFAQRRRDRRPVQAAAPIKVAPRPVLHG
ncbi:MAG: hypothetical protein ABW224_14460 [Kibdelosporangium sp.]